MTAPARHASSGSSPTTWAPDVLWDYFQRCFLAQELLPATDGLLDEEVVIDGVTKTVANMTPSDIERLAEVEIVRIASATLHILDHIDEEVERASSS